MKSYCAALFVQWGWCHQHQQLLLIKYKLQWIKGDFRMHMVHTSNYVIGTSCPLLWTTIPRHPDLSVNTIKLTLSPNLLIVFRQTTNPKISWDWNHDNQRGMKTIKLCSADMTYFPPFPFSHVFLSFKSCCSFILSLISLFKSDIQSSRHLYLSPSLSLIES